MRLKLFSAAALMLLLSASAAYAANGDVVRQIYYTDITTYIDGIPIQGYAIDGKTMICLEDLSNYGFSVYYDNEVRALFVNKYGKADDDFCPNIKREQGNSAAGYTYETDIRAYVNGNGIPAENIGGKLVVCVEELAECENRKCMSQLNLTYHKYFICCNYDDDIRTLNVYSNIYNDGEYDANIAQVMTAKRNAEILDIVETGGYTAHIYRGGYVNSINENGCSAVRYYKNGRVLDAEEVLYTAYSFAESREGTAVYDAEFSADGKYLLFNGVRSKPQKYSLMGMRNKFEDGRYMLDMDTFELIKLDTQSYELPPETKPPVIW